MTYVIDWSSGGAQGIAGKDAIILNAKTYNSTSTSLTLTGKGVENYGEIQQENFIRLLENFASNTAPPNATIGQLWYDTSAGVNALKVFSGGTSWAKASGNSADIIAALGYTPFGNSTSSNPLTNLDITTALGYTPLDKAGGTMTGALILNAAPTVTLGAATMGYVTSAISTALASSMNSLPLSQGAGINVTNLGGPTTPDYHISNTGVISLVAGTNTTVTNNGNGSWSVNAAATGMTGLIAGTNITSVVNNNNGTWTVNAANQTVSSVQTVVAGGTVTTGALSASTGTFSGTLSTTGGANLSISGAITAVGDITSTSDAKLKKDLEKIDNALERVDLLTGYTFTRIDTGRRQAGLLAQDVQKVLPEAVMEGEYLSVAYGNMMGLIVEAIKELKQEVEAIKAKL